MTSPNQHACARFRSIPSLDATPSQCLSRVLIESVSDEVLLNIFCYFLDVSPWDWPRLVHTCRKWRRIAFASQGALHLRLFCTHGIPVQKTLHVWPALPIVVEYGGLPTLNPPVPEDEDNIISAIKQSDRVISICLTVTSSLMEKLSAIEKSFPELQEIVLLSRNGELLTLPSTFQCGQRLRRLHSTGIKFPALLLPLHLKFSINLIDLQLHDAFLPWQFSPVDLKVILCKTTQLRSLSLHFRYRSTTDYDFPLPPNGERAVLPALTRLIYRGSITYLEGIVARIDAPFLVDVEITLFDYLILAHSKLNESIERIEMHTSHCGAQLLSSKPSVVISPQKGSGALMRRLELQSLSKSSLMQISSMAQISLEFSPFFQKNDLHVSMTQPSERIDSSRSGELLVLLNSFTGEKSCHLRLNGDHWTNIFSQPGQHENVLPAMSKLYIPQPGPRHSFLREAVVSVMVSRRLSGHPIEVEYERQCDTSEQRETGSLSHFTIEMLSEDVLMNVFRLFLAATPRIWPILVWVCQRWRQIIFTSPLGLNLRLYCTHGMPVLKSLDCWPVLPIIIKYGGVQNLDPPAPEDDDNIIAALKQSGRVSSITLTVTSSFLDKLSTISEPLSELEELVLLSQNNVHQIFPSTFQWGSCLRTLHSTRIAFPSLPPLLLPCQDLVDLQLHEFPSARYLSPEAFANALFGTPQLRSLTLHLLSFPRRRSYLGFPPPPGERIILAALAQLKYRGTSMYLDTFVGRIDAPRLEDIEIRLFSQPTMDTSQLGQFIQRTEIHTLFSHAKVETSAHAISISFSNSDVSTPLRLHISCKQLDWQLSCMAQVCDQISPFLFHVLDVGIDTAQPLNGREDVNDEQWLDLLCSFKFSDATSFWVANELMTDILRALGHANEGNTAILPSLRHIRVQKPIEMDGPSWNSVQSFITSRSISGRPVQVDAPSYRCHHCYDIFDEQHKLKHHLRDKHRYQILCSYCGEFECMPGERSLFRAHLEDKHREVAREDSTHISKPSLTPFQIDGLVYRHSSLRAPDVMPPSEFTSRQSLIDSDSEASDSDSDSEDSVIYSRTGGPWGPLSGPPQIGRYMKPVSH